MRTRGNLDLLSMHSCCRAGADEVTAVESVGHLAEVAEHIIAINGGSHAITVVHKDGRYLTSGTQPDGRPGDMTSPADLLVFEVGCCCCSARCCG